jgi:hypothetical protein
MFEILRHWSIQLLCRCLYGTAESRIFHRTPAGRTAGERQGERGTEVAMCCYLSHASPPLPPPHNARLSHRLRLRYQD